MAKQNNQKRILSEINEEIGDITTRSDYDEDALSALNKFDYRYSVDAWKMEVGIIIAEQGCTFKEAVYEALIANYREDVDLGLAR